MYRSIPSRSRTRPASRRSVHRSLSESYALKPHRGIPSPHAKRRHSGGVSTVPLVAFLLIVSFGILMTTGCNRQQPLVRGPGDTGEDVTFTEQDVTRFRELARSSSSSSGAEDPTSPHIVVDTTGSGSVSAPILDLSHVKLYNAVRSGPGATGSNLYRVVNEFLNIRSEPNSRASLLVRLAQGDLVRVLEFSNADWAKLELDDGVQGFASTKYIAKVVAQEKLVEEKKAFDGIYFVSFGFVNVRTAPDQKSDKIGEIPGLTFVRPKKIDGEWATVPFQGKDAFVSMKFLQPFLPRFLVRQESFTLPILHYHLQDDAALSGLIAHVGLLKDQGFSLMTMSDIAKLLLEQEKRQLPLDPKAVVIAVSEVTPLNARRVADALAANGFRATVFVQTRHIGINGITEKTLLTLLADGADIESAGHSGDDLRSLTNAQIQLELGQSRKILEELTHTTVLAIGYPQGGTNERVIQMAADAGYLLGTSMGGKKTFGRDQLLRLPAFDITAGMTGEEVLKLVKK